MNAKRLVGVDGLICAKCGAVIPKFEVSYRTDAADDRPYCFERCVDSCDICGATDLIENLVELSSAVDHWYVCRPCDEIYGKGGRYGRRPETLREAFEDFATASRELFMAFITSYKIDRLVGWINRRFER